MTELTVGDVRDLEAVDIFLFSNGDHNTPPRKYHLNTDAFVMWDDTLKSLGRSHFGVDDTVIDIYTISGHKIDDPSQLIHQAAYVAVKPPAPFMQTGYENYLIRATKSWEKRLLKISNSMDSATKGPRYHYI
ncbi:PREDICTED: uncharacterized protein LOC106117094 [Papilio xuthus]|uniref:Uncharacterized protein LOC106117094 n=2 Tax=Papilio xuthus TaxID=66420 RepID=A0AAJ6Z7D0_PAPXU|nr:PREDICTED: uncharacterized protein LOC106117094 [Papilio xuthus]